MAEEKLKLDIKSTSKVIEKIRERRKNRRLPETPRLVGDQIRDGTIYAGISPTSHKPMFVLPKDLSGLQSFNEVADYAAQLRKEKYLGHDDWRVPSRSELYQLWKNKERGALAKSFNEAAGFRDGFSHIYWSATQKVDDPVRAWAFDFISGEERDNLAKSAALSIRIVR